MRFLINTLLTALCVPIFLGWGKEQADAQITKMQEAAFNTPGAESPLPVAVAAAGFGLVVGHFLLGRLLGVSRGGRLLSLLLAGATGGYLFQVRTTQQGDGPL